MDIHNAIDPTPLIIENNNNTIRNGSTGTSSITTTTHDDDDDTQSVAVTLTDFQKPNNSSSITHDRISSSPSSSSSSSRCCQPFRHPLKSTNIYLRNLSTAFSTKFLAWVAIDNFALSGGVMTLLWSVGLPLFKELGIDAARQQLYTTVIISPYALKPFIGVTSDLFIVWGYNKRYWAILSIFIGFVGCIALLLLYHTGAASAAVESGPTSVRHLADLIVICFFAMNLEGATLDILGEGKYSELMRLHPQSGSSIISFKFVWSLIGTIVTQTYVGPLSDAGWFHVLFWIALFLLAAPFYPTWQGWIPETKRSPETEGEGEDRLVRVCRNSKWFLFDRGLFRKKKIPFVAIALLLDSPVFTGGAFYPTWQGWIPETKRSPETEDEGEDRLVRVSWCCNNRSSKQWFLFDRGLFRKKKIPFVAIALSGLAAPLLSTVSTYFDLGIGLACAAFVLLALACTTYVVFPPKFFRITCGLMLLVLCRIKMTSGLSYFYTANAQCLPHGPQFSYTFYITLTGIVGSVIHLVAVMLYQTFLSSWKYRPALIFSMVVGSLATVVDLIIILRWNVAMGIPDKVFFLLGNATFENLTNILHAIPMSAISAKIAPPGMESAVFAYSVGIGTFCFMVSNLLGSAIIGWSGMKTVGEDCNFDNLPHLILVFQILVPVLVGVPATLFIPNVEQTEPIIDWEKERWYEARSDGEGSDRRFESEGGGDEEGLDFRVEPHLL
eukprot:CAMPEP_0183743564 /NCGR_PEP_ID=MMETSP0737-20130205/65280_1 /TAXON_ID=385413 /ORGANISM="Thalassiosira miniscula, Strain CCMP1093" /LENGTH=723 /DNA_ID=CAMNT_0025979185 /DNA_START=208 /DNA_END=2380 /DNA_ORIENTATION=-